MKKIMMCIIVLTTLVGLLCACGGNANDVCSISGCNNQVYKDGLCPDHYVAAQSVPKDDDLPDTQAEENKDVDSLDLELDEDILEESKNDVEDHCQTANCGRHKLRIDFGSFALSDCAA